MPTYDYHCKKCETHTDVFKKLADFDRVETCEACGSEMDRQMSAPPFKLLGGGWAAQGYSNDHVTFKMKDGSRNTVPVKSNKLKKEDK